MAADTNSPILQTMWRFCATDTFRDPLVPTSSLVLPAAALLARQLLPHPALLVVALPSHDAAASTGELKGDLTRYRQ